MKQAGGKRIRRAQGKARGFTSNVSSKDRKRRKRVLLKRDGARCHNCGGKGKLTLDHVKPLSKGGGNDLTNLRLLCPTCNQAKLNG
jgi:5-methylcytosine-specific restriction endonuclease McrA